MSRNADKTKAVLNRFRDDDAEQGGSGRSGPRGRRPRVAASVSSLRECERWRGDIMKDISRKVSKIQDCASPELHLPQPSSPTTKCAT